MKTHVIVQSLSVCLLLAWTVWDIPATDAGGPPIRLAVESQAARFADQLDDELPTATQLLPTEWDRSVQLIPTEVDRARPQWVRLEVDQTVNNSKFGSGLDCPWGPSSARAFVISLNDFLDQQLSESPVCQARFAIPDGSVPNLAPWIVGERPWDMMLGVDLSDFSYFPEDLDHLIAFPEAEILNAAMPACQWWSRVLKPRISEF